MALIDEITAEITQKRGSAVEAGSVPKERKRRNAKTQAEIEAYRQRKMAEEEARYLKDESRPKKTRKPRVSKNVQEMAKGLADTVKRRRTRRSKQEYVEAAITQVQPLQNLQPLCFINIPGLAKGDMVALCLVHGAVR